MPKKKKTTKKKVSKKKKKAKKKSTTKKAFQGIGLQAKRFEIMKAVPTMPCSAINRDMQGLRYCHTQAENVYQIYRNEMMKRGLTINIIEAKSESVLVKKNADGQEFYSSRSHCTFRITDIESGEYDDIQSTALGCNDVWSDNSSQTVAMKQALLQYFFTVWPQPTDYIEVIKCSLDELKGETFKKAVTNMMPDKVITNKQAAKKLDEFFKALGI